MAIFIILSIIFAIGNIVWKNKRSTTIENLQSETGIDSTALNPYYQNVYAKTINNHTENKRYVYILTTARIPKLKVSEIGGYMDFSTDTYKPTQYYYLVEWMESIYTTDIVEIANYNEDEKYKLLDKVDIDVNSKISYSNMNFQAELSLKCNDYREREKLSNENKATITGKEIFDFSSYAEASVHRKSKTENNE